MMARRDYGGGTVEERASGRWRVTVELRPDPTTGKRRRRRYTVQGSKRDALQALRASLNERDHGGVDPNRTTTAEWLQRWHERRVADQAVSPRVAENYSAILTKRVVPAIGSVRLQDLRTEHILTLKQQLSEDLAPATVKKALGLVKQGLSAAVAAQLLVRNPAMAVPSPSLTTGVRERRALDETEVAQLLDAARSTPYDVPIRFSLATGIRQAELLGATWQAIDLERRRFEIHQTLAQLRGRFTMRPPKTRNSLRTVELSDSTVGLLRRHRSTQLEDRLRLGTIWEDQDLVFPGRVGSPQFRQAFYRGFKEVVEHSEIDAPSTVNWHILRHTAASLWLKAGVDVFTVSRRLGHASASFTMDQYGHLLAGQQQAAAEALDHLLG
ncbi:MAG: hypothetical protein BZY69_01645 [SAR202 cluster bacterium Casp-Chloro-G1]|nr:MAG: hypothetical protein BZY69_01645 [SAR202 cluster bacterium Casp-Chloro-G1]